MNISRLFRKTIVCILCLALFSGTLTAFALTGNVSGATPMEKDETVYVVSAADGNVQKIIVSDWLKNGLRDEQIQDVSELTGIENVKGDETYTTGNDNVTVWDAKGNDIYYQGNIDKELPVGLSITYTLDGNPISPEEIAGKSGRATIRFTYENHQYEMVETDGTEEKIYVPFAILTGTLLDNDIFRNVEVTNGKFINDDDHTVVVGISFPGLQDNLAIDLDTLSIPEYVEISADVTDFALDMTFILVTNEVFNDLDALESDTIDDLKEKLESLTDSFSQLTDGMNQLYDGTQSLYDGSVTLSSGIGQLSDGLNTLAENNDALNDGARQVFEAVIETANTQIQATGADLPELTIDNYSEVIADALEMTSLENVQAIARQKVEEAVRAHEKTLRMTMNLTVQADVKSQVKKDFRQSILEQTVQAHDLTMEAYTSLSDEEKSAIDAEADQQMNTSENKAALKQKTSEALNSDATQALLDARVEEQIQEIVEQNLENEKVQEQINEGIEQATAAAESLRDLQSKLDSLNMFYEGLLAYTAGVASAADGASQINSAMPEFVSGVQQLRDGAKQIVDGLSSVDLDKINVTGITNRIKATAEAARYYHNFSGISDTMPGRVKFIYRVEEVH